MRAMPTMSFILMCSPGGGALEHDPGAQGEHAPSEPTKAWLVPVDDNTAPRTFFTWMPMPGNEPWKQLRSPWQACDGEPACRRDSVHRAVAGAGWVVIHLSGLPGDIGRAGRPTLDLAPGGVYRAARVTLGAGALLPHRFTLTCDSSPKAAAHRRSAFCGTFLRVASTGR